MRRTNLVSYLQAGAALAIVSIPSIAASGNHTPTTAPVPAAQQPWMNPGLSPDERARLVEAQMTQAEMLGLVKGWFGIPYIEHPDPNIPILINGNKDFHDVIGSAGYEPGIPRLGIPSLQETDASLGVANIGGMMRPGDVATALPSGMSLVATFNPQTAYKGGAMIAKEAWSKGYGS